MSCAGHAVPHPTFAPASHAMLKTDQLWSGGGTKPKLCTCTLMLSDMLLRGTSNHTELSWSGTALHPAGNANGKPMHFLMV